MALNAGLRFLMHFADAGDRAAGADAGDEDVDLAVGVAPDFLGRGLAVDLRVGRVLELLRHEGVRVVGDQLLGLARPRRACPSPPASAPSRRRSALSSRRRSRLMLSGMVTIELVAAGGADERQADAGVAAGRLDDDRVLLDLARRARRRRSWPAPMRSLTDHSGLKFSSLADDRGLAAFGHAAQPDQRRVADALGDVVANAAGADRGHKRVSSPRVNGHRQDAFHRKLAQPKKPTKRTEVADSNSLPKNGSTAGQVRRAEPDLVGRRAL